MMNQTMALSAQKVIESMGLRQLIGQSPAFLDEVNRIPLVAPFDVSILILGETGTGKEIFARAIHYLSPRSSKPFIPVNCGAIPTELIENELFGHEEGAFTNAAARKSGLVEEAEGGTLFLDEVDCLPPLAQVKLLRFLQEKEYRALGSTKIHKSNVRVISATNSDVEKALTEGRLRHDLYYRLNVVQFLLPPLKHRQTDVGLLARHFLVKYSEQFNKSVNGFSDAAMAVLSHYSWPGNVRELENTVERAVILAHDGTIGANDILLPLQAPSPYTPRSFREIKTQVISEFERSYILDLLSSSKGNITHAARAARKNRRAFLELMRKHGITSSIDQTSPVL